MNDTEGESIALNNIAAIYQLQGNYDKALEYSNKALQLTAKPSSIALAYNNIEVVYSDKGNKIKQLNTLKKL